MRQLIVSLGLLLASGALADEPKKPEAKKTEAKKTSKPAAKSDKNVFQKAESNTGKFLHDNKLWTKSENRSR